MKDTTRILFISANPATTARVLVDQEIREIAERLEQSAYRDQFQLIKHTATRPSDLQRLMLQHNPHIVHFSGHCSKEHKLILEGPDGGAATVDQSSLTQLFALYNRHVRLVLLNACFTKTQAKAISKVVPYSIGISRPIGDKAATVFAGAFYLALGFGRSIREAFASALVELNLTKLPRSRAFHLFVQNGITEEDRFPSVCTAQPEQQASPKKENPAPFRPNYQLTTQRPFTNSLINPSAANDKPAAATRR